jgi:hypothetical protein
VRVWKSNVRERMRKRGKKKVTVRKERGRIQRRILFRRKDPGNTERFRNLRVSVSSWLAI